MIRVIVNKNRPHLLMYNAVDDTYKTNILPGDEFTLHIDDRSSEEEIEIFQWLAKDNVYNYNTAIKSLESFSECKRFFYSISNGTEFEGKTENPDDYQDIITDLKKKLKKAKRIFDINQL